MYVGEEDGPVEAGRVSLHLCSSVSEFPSLPSGEFRKCKTLRHLLCAFAQPVHVQPKQCAGKENLMQFANKSLLEQSSMLVARACLPTKIVGLVIFCLITNIS
ncbi:hypothetical protein BRADI_1g46656v3 [Brachypodium distachyon]|uniref:Uncharacterized protein n=1 Tax=Brachypodium distachyon TaxID=15368 RepID=A0A0Q3K3Y3_BRADI|nr:hypothetical protein BRADI_1g46656v3 [Brachypodium distachyon]